MSKLKEVIVILSLAVLICLAAEFLIAFLIYNHQAASVNEEVNVLADYHAASSAAKISDSFDNVFVDINDMSYGELAEEYGYAGSYNSIQNKISLVGQDDKTPHPTAESTIKSGEKTISSYPLNQIITDDALTGEYIMYTQQLENDPDIYTIVLQTEAHFNESLSENYFDYYAFVSASGRVCMTNNEQMQGRSFFEYYLQLYDQAHWMNDFTPRPVTIGNIKYLVAYQPLSYSLGAFGVVGLIDYSRVDAVISETLSFVTLIIVLFGLFILLVVAGLTVYLLYKKQKKFTPREIGKQNFNVTVTAIGDVLKCSKNFKKFKKENIFDAVINKDLELSYSLGSNLVCYLNEDGKQTMVSFVIVEKDSKLNFRMVGVEISDNKLEEYKKEITDDFSLRHGFKNRYLKASSMDTFKIICGIIEISNIKKLQTMFGPKVSHDVVAAIEDRIRKHAETSYPLDAQNKGILITKEKEVDFFQNGIKTFFNELNKPVTSGDMLVDVQVIGGFVLVDRFTTDKTFDYTMKCAQAALKRVVATEGAKYFIFHDSVKKQYVKFFDYDFDIGKMLDEEDFEMQYQPQYSIKDGKVTAFEALFRVKEHLGLQIDIGRLIDYIQYEGQIGMIGKFTFENCLRFAKEIENKKIKLSVNVSPLQFMQVGFVSTFADMVSKYEVDPETVDIEITETFLVGNIEEAANKIKELKKYGIGVHLDDFGKEYSSLNYLNRMPVEAVKIDRDFIIGITQSEKSKTLVQSIIDMVHKLGIEAIAEGVETEDQFNLLKEMKCDLIQGYYIGKSMTEKRVLEMLDPKNKSEARTEGPAGAEADTGNRAAGAGTKPAVKTEATTAKPTAKGETK